MKYSLGKPHAFCALALLAVLCSAYSSFADNPFHSGDEFVVAQQRAPLMRGSEALATLSQGQRYHVLRTEGDWLGTTAVLNGQTITGWVHSRQVATPAQYAQRRTTRRSYSYQPGTVSPSYSYGSRGYSSRSSSNNGFIMGQTPYGPSYWRADRKIKGY